MKPIGKSQGKGIFLFNKLSQITQWKSDYRWKPDNPQVEAYVVQKYISNPYLIGGKKFDMRLYALVTSFQPLTVYVYRSGFTRFSASRYSNDPADIVNAFVHLTNVAIQKTGPDYNPDTGGKWELKRLKSFMIAK
jgi:tubulin polyglutamylase TTLL9